MSSRSKRFGRTLLLQKIALDAVRDVIRTTKAGSQAEEGASCQAMSWSTCRPLSGRHTVI
jgi:hypothetical protein